MATEKTAKKKVKKAKASAEETPKKKKVAKKAAKVEKPAKKKAKKSSEFSAKVVRADDLSVKAKKIITQLDEIEEKVTLRPELLQDLINEIGGQTFEHPTTHEAKSIMVRGDKLWLREKPSGRIGNAA